MSEKDPGRKGVSHNGPEMIGSSAVFVFRDDPTMQFSSYYVEALYLHKLCLHEHF